MKYLVVLAASISLVSDGSPAHASNTDRKKESFLLKAVKGVALSAADSAVRAGMKSAGVYACPKGKNCYCSRKKLACMYIEKDGAYKEVKTYHDVDACIALCLGKDKTKVIEGKDVKG